MKEAPQKAENTVYDIMSRIRERIKNSANNLEDVLPARKQASLDASSQRKGGELALSEDLRFLNREYSYPSRLTPEARISTHRNNLLGKSIVWLKRKLFSFIWTPLRDELSSKMSEYQQHLVRYLNEVAVHGDQRDSAIFWELVRKIDYDSERMDVLMRECRATLHSFQENQNVLGTRSQQQYQEQQNKLQSLTVAFETADKVARGLEATFLTLAKVSKPASAIEQDFPDPSYVVFENRFRGSQDEIRSRLALYVDTFRGAAKPVLDIGCGRGELLQLFKEANIESYGVDLDDAMLRLAAEKGLSAKLGDGIRHLASLADNSLGGVVAIQVVEHLPLKVLQALMEQAYRVVAPGGSIAFETINPRSVAALYSNYFRDPTHVFPVHPDTLQHIAVAAGFKGASITELSPMPDAVKLMQIQEQPFMSPQWQSVVGQLNHNVKLLNELLYGAQDYCLRAKK